MKDVSQPDVSFLLQEHANISNDVIFAVQPQNNHLLYLSPAFEKIWEMSREQVNGNFGALMNTIHSEDQALLKNALAAIQQTKHISGLEMRLLLANSIEKWICMDAYLTQFNSADAIIGSFTEITNYKDFSNTLYKFANKKNAILDILSHDLLNPMASIESSAKLLKQHTADSGDELVNKMLNIIVGNSEKCVKMIRDLVNKEMRESSEVPLILQRTDIVKRIAEVVEQYKSTFHTIKQQVTLVTATDSLYITVDETKFMQVINNLLSNALKLTRDTDEIKVIIEDQQTTVLIQVKDNGIGIPQDLQPFIFEKYTKASRVGIKGEPTHGLGLSIIKNIIEWHHGRVWFESAEGQGTTFYVEVPKDSAR